MNDFTICKLERVMIVATEESVGYFRRIVVVLGQEVFVRISDPEHLSQLLVEHQHIKGKGKLLCGNCREIASHAREFEKLRQIGRLNTRFNKGAMAVDRRWIDAAAARIRRTLIAP